MTKHLVTFLLVLSSAVGCGGVATTEGTSSGADGGADSASDAPAQSDDVTAAADAASDAPTRDGGAGACATAEPDACIACCRQPEAPNYGGFELYASDLCAAAPACEGKSPCGTNLTPAGGSTCVLLLKKAIAQMGVSPACATNKSCSEFAACIEGCGSRLP